MPELQLHIDLGNALRYFIAIKYAITLMTKYTAVVKTNVYPAITRLVAKLMKCLI